MKPNDRQRSLAHQKAALQFLSNHRTRRRGRVLITAGLDVIDRHFAAENAHDIEATLATYTETIVWDDVTHPGSPFRGKQAIAEVYGGILQAIPDIHLRSVSRFQCADHVVDESIVTGHVMGRVRRRQRGRGTGQLPPASHL